MYQLKDFLGSQASAQRDAEKVAKLQKEAEANWGDPRWHKAQAALIAEAVDRGLNNPEVFSGVLRQHTLARTDKLARKTRYGVKVFKVAAGARIDESTLSTDMVEADRVPLAWHVVSTPEEALADYAETLATMVSLAQKAEQIEIVRRELDLLDAASAANPTSYIDGSSSAAAYEAAVKLAIRRVSDADVAGNGGVLPSQIRIIGRARGVDGISEFSGFGLNTLDAINSTGYLGVYRGAQVVRLVNHVDSDGVSFMDEQYVWVVRNDAGDFARFGAARVKNWEENELDKAHWTSRRDTGGYVVEPGAICKVKVV